MKKDGERFIREVNRGNKTASLGVHLNLDGAWESGILGLRELDLRSWGPRLRYCAPAVEVQAFFRQVEKHLAPFVLYGSGDFHYLTALLVRGVARPVTIVSFDNHPDWDRRPPGWNCGGWTRRALECGKVEHISVWGCGNYELRFPSRLFADHVALRAGRLRPYAWAERQDPSTRRQFDCITRQNWKELFKEFSSKLEGHSVYITVDLDCLRAEDVVTNWENGLFTVDDLAWALSCLSERAQIIGGDICGAYSPPCFARWTQRLASSWDHPKVLPPEAGRTRRINRAALDVLWPALTGWRRECV
jgi:arginase family enzyme